MEKLGIKYCGPIYDGSGYAQFARNFIVGLSRHPAVDLTLQGVSFEQARPDLGSVGSLLKKYEGKKINYDIKIVNGIPDMLPKLVEADKKNICFTMFETSRIPTVWVDCLNKHANACFVPCTWNKEVFQNSGVTIPVYVVPPGIDADYYKQIQKVEPTELANLPAGCVAFYSIFQWTERKNPIGLITAYLAAFDEVEDVYLVLKTYGSDNSPVQQKRIRDIIVAAKGQVRLKKAPKILFIGSLLSTEQISGLHKRCDCFVLPHRAEGFGMPHLEAMACGKPVIATGFSGNMDFMTQENSYLLDYQMTIVSNMPWIPYYEADMEWAEPDLTHLKRIMKEVYSDVKASRLLPKAATTLQQKVMLGQMEVFEKFNLDTAANRFVKYCKEIHK